MINLNQEEALSVVKLLSIQGYNKEIRKCLLTKTELKVCKFIINSGDATAKDVSNKINIDTPHASTLLTRLYNKSFLSRVRNINIANHVEYKYHFSLNIK